MKWKPNAPIDLNLADEDDSGSSNSDNLTKETSGLTISGTANIVPSLSLMTIPPVPLAIVSLNVATRLLFGPY
jgi:hypothetical protein